MRRDARRQQRTQQRTQHHLLVQVAAHDRDLARQRAEWVVFRCARQFTAEWWRSRRGHLLATKRTQRTGQPTRRFCYRAVREHRRRDGEQQTERAGDR